MHGNWLPRHCYSCLLLQPWLNYLDFVQNSQLNYLWKAIYSNPGIPFFSFSLSRRSFFVRKGRRREETGRRTKGQDLVGKPKGWSHTAIMWTEASTAGCQTRRVDATWGLFAYCQLLFYFNLNNVNISFLINIPLI